MRLIAICEEEFLKSFVILKIANENWKKLVLLFFLRSLHFVYETTVGSHANFSLTFSPHSVLISSSESTKSKSIFSAMCERDEPFGKTPMLC